MIRVLLCLSMIGILAANTRAEITAPAPIDTAMVRLAPQLEELTERLAENTHDLWARQGLADGWTLRPPPPGVIDQPAGYRDLSYAANCRDAVEFLFRTGTNFDAHNDSAAQRTPSLRHYYRRRPKTMRRVAATAKSDSGCMNSLRGNSPVSI